MESRQETGPKAETREDRRGNRTRQNNKRTDRKMESTTSLRFQTGVRHPKRHGGVLGIILNALNVSERTRK